MKHLKYFETEAAYASYKNGSDYILPNVSYIVETEGVSYDPYIEPPFNMVDLGLPSGRLWCDRNIGATSSEDIGLVFQWGDIIGYTVDQFMNGEKRFATDFSDYFDKSFTQYNTNVEKLKSKDDAAYVHMGAEYRMPTDDDFSELINNTTVYKISIDGEELSKDSYFTTIKGIKLVGSNGNSIYIPSLSIVAEDSIWGPNLRPDTITEYSAPHLWSSTSDEYSNQDARYFFVDQNLSQFVNTSSIYKYFGIPVRAVKDKSIIG